MGEEARRGQQALRRVAKPAISAAVMAAVARITQSSLARMTTARVCDDAHSGGGCDLFRVMLAVGGIVGADIEMIPKVGPPGSHSCPAGFGKS